MATPRDKARTRNVGSGARVQGFIFNGTILRSGLTAFKYERTSSDGQ